MHIINAMFGKGLGGIEQSFVDYCEALKMQGDKITAIIHPKAKIRPQLIPLNVNIIEVKNRGSWDIFAKIYLKKILKQLNADATIAHGKRAFSLLKEPANTTKTKLIGVTHNYTTDYLLSADTIFATTENLRKKVINEGQKQEKVFNIPNMIRLSPHPVCIKQFGEIPTIGAMGRFVKKKGFDIFLHAISNLKKKGIKIKVVIGGSGEEEIALKNLTKSLDIEGIVEFKGWINNKDELFDIVDIFCLPSIHEPFGIILLEAFAHGKTVITTDSEGPMEIATNDKDAIIVTKGDSEAMSAAIEALINNPEKACKLAKEGLETVRNYSMEKVGGKMQEILEKSCKA